MPEFEDYLSVKDAAKELHLSQDTLYAYLRMGGIEGAFKFAGTRWMVPKQWIDDYLAGDIDVRGIWKDWRKRCKNLKKNLNKNA